MRNKKEELRSGNRACKKINKQKQDRHERGGIEFK